MKLSTFIHLIYPTLLQSIDLLAGEGDDTILQLRVRLLRYIVGGLYVFYSRNLSYLTVYHFHLHSTH